MLSKITDKEKFKSGKEVRRYVRIHVIGKSGTGKTSIVRGLLGQDIGDVKSTDGIDIFKQCQIRTDDGKWIVSEGELCTCTHIC